MGSLSGVAPGLIVGTTGLLLYLLAHKIPLNPLFGFRIGYAFISRDVWVRVNREAGAVFAVVGYSSIAVWALTSATLTYLYYIVIGVLAGTAFFIYRAVRLAEYYSTMAPAKGSGFKPIEVPRGSLWRLSLALIMPLTPLALFLSSYRDLPSSVAVHFNAEGAPDVFVGKAAFVGVTAAFVLIAALPLAIIAVSRRYPMLMYNPWVSITKFTNVVTDVLIAISAMVVVSYLDVIRYNVLKEHVLPVGYAVALTAVVLAFTIARFTVLWRCRR
ncbi:MAG: hypothetical protein B6U73_03845 [Desulfurococcales archaeon ex4484_204]|nr:MAG: hypothetical protein B6U73_03845 [Desulfurococcales archaeon ex4484_204]